MEDHTLSLAEVPLFQGLSKKQLEQISSLMTRIREGAGTVLAKEGEPGYEFIIVLSGTIEVRRGTTVVATLGAGSYLGEIALLGGRPRTATVVATTDVEIEVLDRREFMSLLADVPELALPIMETMAERLEELEGTK